MPPESTLDSADLDWLTLDDGESVVWAGNPHESSMLPSVLMGLPLCLVLVGFAVIAEAYLSRENTQFVVTTDALYKKTGIFSRDVQRIDFEKVQNTSYSQGFFGTRFGYGDVDVSTAGGSGVEMRFGSVPDPKGVQELVNKRVKAGRPSDTETGESKGDVLDDILTELRAIRHAVEADANADDVGDIDSGDVDADDTEDAAGRGSAVTRRVSDDTFSDGR
ncbi:PH domain-containing protein [Halocalculus aciditolerans]|uniref:YdbS-like PH domain-containing protein n=1 Tax=Halocalculus aciditolerans TaxID=1383812 RepID=A0A830F3T2_9EURY|nr:PH domain-containing protein [Halocalculus aciditolerans]GGL59851.1 hypothetical protein GCM10009039_17590 [Halocalculus aciditolerans]